MKIKKQHQSAEKSLSGNSGSSSNDGEEQPGKVTIGGLLKEKRIEMGLSIDQLAEITKLKAPILESLENESWDELPSAAFASGFVRSYGMALGFEEAQIMACYHESGPVKISAPKPLLKPIKRKKGLLIVFIFILLAACLSYYFWEELSCNEDKKNTSIANTSLVKNKAEKPLIHLVGQNKSKSKHTSIHNQTEALPKKSDASDKQGKDEDALKITDKSIELSQEQNLLDEDDALINNQAPIPSGKIVTPKLTLKANVIKKTWIKIFVDDKEPVEYTLNKGRHFEWKAEKGFELLIGNAGGIDLELDGEKVEKSSTPGQVVRLMLPKNYHR